MHSMQRINVIDTHSAGEPTRVVMSGGPDLGSASSGLVYRRALFAAEFDGFRSAITNEPRGSDVLVGALLVPPTDPQCAAGIIFFNNVGYLRMCGHGTMGVVVALGHAGQMAAGLHQFETPVGKVTVDYDGRNGVEFENVPSYRHAAGVRIEVPNHGPVTGDVAWGGNWFFLVDQHQHREALTLSNVDRLTEVSWRIRQALEAQGVTGRDGETIDHIELFGPPADSRNHARNFVLCPGKAYDRSPCGTGTSAKLACLYADGKLKSGEPWRQESIVGSVFEGSVRVGDGDSIIPRIRGSAFVIAESTLLIDPADPFARGIRS
jgi:4-hydroxyproline epimerase